MSEPQHDAPGGGTGPRGRARGTARLAWLVIIAAVGVIMWNAARGDPAEDDSAGSRISFQLELAGKMYVGAARYATGSGELFLGQFDAAVHADAERLAAAILAGELVGPEQALARLDEALESPEPAPELVAVRDALVDLYRDLGEQHGALPSVSADERRSIQDRLGWFGALALHAPGVDDETGRERLMEPLFGVFVVLLAITCWFGFFAVAGLGLLIAGFVMAMTGHLCRDFAAASGRGPIYAETFAIWVVLFFGGQILLRELASRELVPPAVGTVGGLLIFWASLLVLAWPVKRGIPWEQVRRDVGLTRGRGPLAEALTGWVAYASAIPLLIVGAIIFWASSVIVERFVPGGPTGPSHPVQESIAGGSWAVIAVTFFLACVTAPVVEETMFRGVLYRHLRDATGRMAPWLSIGLSVLASSFLFAVIHPQGLLFAPLLTGLAAGFCLAREWRGSLITCMTAHAISNFIILMLNVALFRWL